MLSCCGLTRDTFITRQSRDVHEQKKLLTSAPTSRSYRYSRNEVEGINVIEFVLSEVENDIILQNESFYLYRKFLFLVLPASQHLLGNLFDPDSWGSVHCRPPIPLPRIKITNTPRLLVNPSRTPILVTCLSMVCITHLLASHLVGA